MSNLVLESVGCVVDDEGMTHPIEFDGCVNMTPDVAVHLLDTDDTWWNHLSVQNSEDLIGFLTPLITDGDLEWEGSFLDWGMDKLQWVFNHQYMVENKMLNDEFNATLFLTGKELSFDG